MFLHALATANPAFSLSQRECAEIARGSAIASRLNRRSQLILHSVLTGDSGIDRRYFAIRDIPAVFDYTPDRLNEAFRREGPELAIQALEPALKEAGVAVGELDALFVCTCTGYLCPGLTSYVAERLGMRPDAPLHDIVGHGCGAAIPMLRLVEAYLKAYPAATVATVAVEVCSAAFYLDDDPGVLVSACLFGDGAAAAVWKGTPGKTGLRAYSFTSVHRPEHRDEIRFENRQGKLRNLLAASVPGLAAEAVGELWEAESRRPGMPPLTKVLAHPGGREVINAVEQRLPQYGFEPGRAVLRKFGNMSSPSVLFVLDEALKAGRPAMGEDWWLVSFGAGFSAHGCRLGYSPPGASL